MHILSLPEVYKWKFVVLCPPWQFLWQPYPLIHRDEKKNTHTHIFKMEAISHGCLQLSYYTVPAEVRELFIRQSFMCHGLFSAGLADSTPEQQNRGVR